MFRNTLIHTIAKNETWEYEITRFDNIHHLEPDKKSAFICTQFKPKQLKNTPRFNHPRIAMVEPCLLSYEHPNTHESKYFLEYGTEKNECNIYKIEILKPNILISL